MKPKIVVIGSSNTDMVIKTDTLPLPGETVLGGTFFMNAGGKGANQAVAAARLNSDVTFIAKRGNDVFGTQAVQGFQQEGIDTNYVFTDEVNASGIALITVDAKGENCIVVAPGANASLGAADIDKATTAIEKANMIIMQLEIPLLTVAHVIKKAVGKNKRIILNPAPAMPLPYEIYAGLFLLTPNEKEAELLSGIAVSNRDSAAKAALFFIDKGAQQVIITLGKQGALWSNGKDTAVIPSPQVNAVDTTAAGDIFNGALAVALSEGKEIKEAIVFANGAAALSVTRLGAQASAPYRKEVEVFLQPLKSI